jgi:cell division septum initiation protein DivIVA
LQDNVKSVTDQVELLKMTLSKAGNDHSDRRAEIDALKAELDSKRLRLDELQKRLAANKRKLDSEYSHLGTLEAKERELDMLLEQERRRSKQVRSVACVDRAR